MKAIGYIRVSTTEQAESGLGLDAQRQAIESEAQRRGWQVEWVEDAGYSAKSLDRPGLTHALEALRRGHAEALVLARLDRLSRSMLDFATVMEDARGQGWALVSVDLGVGMTTPSGRLLANVFAAFAEFERELIRQRTRDTLTAAKARGQRLGRPRETPDAVVAQVVDLHTEGLSLRTIAAALTDKGVPTTRSAPQWRASSVRRILNGHRLDCESVASKPGASQ